MEIILEFEKETKGTVVYGSPMFGKVYVPKLVLMQLDGGSLVPPPDRLRMTISVAVA